MNDHDAPSPRRRRHPLRWLSVIVIALVIGVLGGGYLGSHTLNPIKWGIWSSSTDTEVVQSIELKQDVTLMSLGIQGLKEVEKGTHIGTWKVPGTTSTTYLKYSFDGQLGLDGSKVSTTKTGEKAYKVSIPAFKFLGHDNEKFETSESSDGVLSFVTPDADHDDLVNSVLDDSTEAQYVKQNEDLLERQAKDFYSNIIHAIDPDITLTFTFAGAPASK